MARKLVLLLGLLAVLVSGLVAIQAQDNSGQGTTGQDQAGQTGQDAGQMGMINCDEDLILQMSVADRFFGWGTWYNQVRGAAADQTLFPDLNTFNRGQYSNWYSTWSGSTANTGMPHYGILAEDQFMNLSNTLTMDDASFQEQWNTATGFDANAGTALNPFPGYQGEPAECMALRNNLNRFWRSLMFTDFSSGNMIGSMGAQGNMGATDQGAAGQGSTDQGTTGQGTTGTGSDSGTGNTGTGGSG